ncbi:MAG: Polyribonucleotide nucleotidyltransferase [Myxococcota bacterium]|nr:Polyribonucleotide nucleotidyltransferase [Myxococcota bacterium]
MAAIVKTATLGDQQLILETGHVARQAHGSVIAKTGDTWVMVTVCADKKYVPGIDFLPLTVEYMERSSAAGKIPGGFFKREGRASTRETLGSRLIDRSLRPTFPDGWPYETQLISQVISAAPENDPVVAALNGASAALMISDIPFDGPLGCVQIGYIGGRFVINPNPKLWVESAIHFTVSGSRTAIVMVEGSAHEADENLVVDGLLTAHQALQASIDAQLELVREAGKPKRETVPLTRDAALVSAVREIVRQGLLEATSTTDKILRYNKYSEIKKQAAAALAERFPTGEGDIKAVIEDVKTEIVRNRILEEGRRIDGRDTKTVRPITVEAGVLPRVHGSALFTRGETQALVSATLGTAVDEQLIETLHDKEMKRFMLHYNFPPFSVGEVKPMRGPGRREIGHGNLAERALLAVVPKHEEFPYTIRVVSDITESNGSSSMASVCGGALALMDAGVPIKAPVAGVAMGLIAEGEKMVVLTDILGDEDHLGDMDFKVCGTEKGVTALQMDIKIKGINREILSNALAQAKEARLHVLEQMNKVLSKPRADISQYAPRITTIHINPERIRDLIGPGGKVIKDIIAKTGVEIDVDDSGRVNVASANRENAERALKMIKDLTQEAEVGKLYLGTVVKIMDFGAFVEILPGVDGLCHISEISDKRIAQVTDVLHEGDEVVVKVLAVDPKTGKIKLSRKAALAEGGVPTA